MTAFRRPVCPVDVAHGSVQDWATSRWGFHCSHADHDGRPKTHPTGELAPSRAFFTTAEVEIGFIANAQPASVSGEPRGARSTASA